MGGVVCEQLENPGRGRRWQAAVATTLGAWLVAFLVVIALLSVFRDELGSLPLALRALVISGVLVALMVNLVMPMLSVAVARWLGGSPQTRSPSGRLGTGSGEQSRA
jgi:antibiotic biosynthesis monooxygenase (ABM) superfamily enzyme